MHIPEGFVYLKDIEPSILQEVRYAGFDNFIGRPIEGYQHTTIVVSKALGEALIEVQKKAIKLDLCLKIYDAYRPLRAVNDFLNWSLNNTDQRMKQVYYPYVEKKRFFSLGFLALRSAHCRGAAVDLTVVKKVDSQWTTLDMGTPFDYFDQKSYTYYPDIPERVRKNRDTLQHLMTAGGFHGYEKEWWHFTLNHEPFPNTYFDFTI
jgi:D-alanyl-D-alanine dipeptidase